MPAGAGEIHELKEELGSPDRSRRKDAVKKVIAAMTVGKDVSMLFPNVVNCMQTEDMELKKLVYLYLINYAKSQPDLTIMAVNTFVKVSDGTAPSSRRLFRTRRAFPSLFPHTRRRASCILSIDNALMRGPRLPSCAGLPGSKPADPCAGRAHDGLHPS